MAPPFKPTTDEVIRELPINRSYRKMLLEVIQDSIRGGEDPIYIYEEDDTIHDPFSLAFQFLDTATLACGRKIKDDDRPGTPLDNNWELCPECAQALLDWDELDPAGKVIRQFCSAIEGITEARRQGLHYSKLAAELILEEGDEDDIFKLIALSFAAPEDMDEAYDNYKVLSKRSIRKLGRWGYADLPLEIKQANSQMHQDLPTVEKETQSWDEVVAEYLKNWREAHRSESPTAERQPPVRTESIESREERLARRRAEREERERQAAEAAAHPVAQKPRKRNRQLEEAITTVQIATGDERVAALRVLRQIALDCGDGEWASYAKAELRGTRDCSS